MLALLSSEVNARLKPNAAPALLLINGKRSFTADAAETIAETVILRTETTIVAVGSNRIKETGKAARD